MNWVLAMLPAFLLEMLDGGALGHLAVQFHAYFLRVVGVNLGFVARGFYAAFSGNKPGIQRDARAAGNTRCNGA